MARPTSRKGGAGRLLEKPFMLQVVHWAKFCGWEVFHHDDSRKEVAPGVLVGDELAKGFPDLVLVRDRILYRELKRDGEYPDRYQRYWGARLTAAHQDYDVWRPADWDATIHPLLQDGRTAWLKLIDERPDLQFPADAATERFLQSLRKGR